MRIAALLLSITGTTLAFAPHKAVVKNVSSRGWKSSSDLSMSGKCING